MSSNHSLHDISKLAESVLHTGVGMRKEIEAVIKQRLEQCLREMDVVTRDEFEVLKAMVSTLREENDALKKTVASLKKKPVKSKAKTA